MRSQRKRVRGPDFHRVVTVSIDMFSRFHRLSPFLIIYVIDTVVTVHDSNLNLSSILYKPLDGQFI